MLSHDDLNIILHSSYASDEAVAATRHRLYELLTVAIPHRLSEQRDILRQASFLNEAVRPKPSHQFFFFQKAPAVFYQRKEHIECLWGERDGLSVAKEKALLRVKAEVAEFV